MILKLFVLFYSFNFCAISTSMEANSKSVIPVPTADWNDIKGHSYLRLATPSGNIYHFTDDQGLVREFGNDTEISNLPFLTVNCFGSEYYIYLRNIEIGYQLATRRNTDTMMFPHNMSLLQFTGVDKKMYTASLNQYWGEVKRVVMYQDLPLPVGYNGFSHYQVPIPNDVPGSLDYLEFLIKFDEQLLAFTFTEDGSDLVDMADCTNTKLLLRAQGNSYNKTLPYITFKYRKDSVFSFDDRESQWYDIFFPANGSLPFLMKNKSRPRDKCGKHGIHIKSFKGPDNIHYELEYNWTLDADGRHYFKVGHNYNDGDLELINEAGIAEIIRFLDNDESEVIAEFLINYSARANERNVDIYDFKCLLDC